MSSCILIISPEPWEAHFVSKHHYAQELARRGHVVLFYGPPTRGGAMRLDAVEGNRGRLLILRAPRVAPGLRRMPGPLRRALEARWLEKVERLVGMRIDVVWNFENSRFFDMGFAGKRLKIYHQVDLNQDFEPEIAAATADRVFCTSRRIRDRLRGQSQKVTVIPHGVQVVDWAPETEASLFDSALVNCAYVGNMSMKYIDRDLLCRCVEGQPKLAFHFFGGFDENDPFEARLRSFPNVQLHGKVDARRVLPIIANADILMVTYEKSHFADQSSPHKMMEYMMSGKITVATFTAEFESVSDLLVMCPEDGDYFTYFVQVAANPTVWNTPEQVARRQAFATENTYTRQLDRIAAALGPSGALIS